ncbi:MAG: hypothetical protein KUG77_16305 [Nannocystaceae bacterium]|nr:hypothetical protein [Nannocystaceae bacterium]
MGVLLCLGACGEAPTDVVGERGLGDADGVYGECAQDACGEAAPGGNCWCDEACVEHGDCCGDKVDSCGGAGPDPLLPVLCDFVTDCPSGLTCDTSECYSSCRDGEDCDASCLGMCVEPQQQALPAPTADVPEPTEPSSEPDAEPASDGAADPEVPECDCEDEADLCVPLCPVCPSEVPDEDCQCTTVCVSV